MSAESYPASYPAAYNYPSKAVSAPPLVPPFSQPTPVNTPSTSPVDTSQTYPISNQTSPTNPGVGVFNAPQAAVESPAASPLPSAINSIPQVFPNPQTQINSTTPVESAPFPSFNPSNYNPLSNYPPPQNLYYDQAAQMPVASPTLNNNSPPLAPLPLSSQIRSREAWLKVVLVVVLAGMFIFAITTTIILLFVF